MLNIYFFIEFNITYDCNIFSNVSGEFNLEKKRIHVIEDLCTGCRLCQLICSLENTKEFNPKKANINVTHIDEHGTYIPVLDCDESKCLTKSTNEKPKCVQVCAPGALIYETIEKAVEMKKDLVLKRTVQPLFKVFAPWKWPFPWKEWPFERGNKSE